MLFFSRRCRVPSSISDETYHLLFSLTQSCGVRVLLRPPPQGNAPHITTPAVRDAGREFFGCPTLQGVALENNGGGGTAGNHWEASRINSQAHCNRPVVAQHCPLRLCRWKSELGFCPSQ